MKFLNLPVGQQLWQKGRITYIRKKGSQQMTKTPIIMPSVRAALRSFEREIFCFSSMNWLTALGFFCSDVAAATAGPVDDCGGVSFSEVCSSAWVTHTWGCESNAGWYDNTGYRRSSQSYLPVCNPWDHFHSPYLFLHQIWLLHCCSCLVAATVAPRAVHRPTRMTEICDRCVPCHA